MRKSIVDSLQNGMCVFRLGYYDRNLSIPFVEPFFFLGKNLFASVDDAWFFQNATHYLNGASASSMETCEEAGIYALSYDDLGDMVDWNGLISELAENKKLQDEGKYLSQKVL